jgi:glutamate 5-kinase
VNENDVVAVDELAALNFGDNDTLSALVAGVVEADLVVLLSDIAGLYTSDPRLDPAATLIERVDRVDAAVERLAGAAGTARGRGGMVTKLRAARLATAAGTDVIIADGRLPGALIRAARGDRTGTLFPAAVSRLESKKRWLLGSLIGRPRILIDEGAVRALQAHGRSLLPVGVRRVEGRFDRGDTVVVADRAGRQIACGIANYSSQDLETIRGQRSDRIEPLLGYEFGAEIIHRDNLVLLDHDDESKVKDESKVQSPKSKVGPWVEDGATHSSTTVEVP